MLRIIITSCLCLRMGHQKNIKNSESDHVDGRKPSTKNTLTHFAKTYISCYKCYKVLLVLRYLNRRRSPKTSAGKRSKKPANLPSLRVRPLYFKTELSNHRAACSMGKAFSQAILGHLKTYALEN